MILFNLFNVLHGSQASNEAKSWVFDNGPFCVGDERMVCLKHKKMVIPGLWVRRSVLTNVIYL